MSSSRSWYNQSAEEPAYHHRPNNPKLLTIRDYIQFFFLLQVVQTCRWWTVLVSLDHSTHVQVSLLTQGDTAVHKKAFFHTNIPNSLLRKSLLAIISYLRPFVSNNNVSIPCMCSTVWTFNVLRLWFDVVVMNSICNRFMFLIFRNWLL